jgi:hypothetical protein
MKRVWGRVGVSVAAATIAVAGAAPDSAGALTFLPPSTSSMSLDTITSNPGNPGPWTLGQGNPLVAGSPFTPYSGLLPTFAFGGSPTFTFPTPGGLTYPNVATEPGATSPPFATNVAGTPGPLSGYCGSGGPSPTPATGAVNREPTGVALPLQPYYFPFIVRKNDHSYTGYFDYRNKDTDEAIVAATSSDLVHWTYQGEALESNKDICPNNNVNDDGTGHQVVLRVPSYVGPNGGEPHPATLMYMLNRPPGNADVAGSQLLVHKLTPNGSNPLAGLPASEPTGEGGVTSATATVGTVAAPGSAGSTVTVGTTVGWEIPGRVYDTTTATRMVCAGNTATTFTGCVTAQDAQYPGNTLSVNDKIAADPVVPQTSDPTLPEPSGPDPSVAQTHGLSAPDGIIGTVPNYPGAPGGSTIILYTEKLKNYFAPTSVTSNTTVATPSFKLPVQSTSGLIASSTGSYTVTVGDDTTSTLIQVTCTSAGSAELDGCTTSAADGNVIKAGNSVGTLGACVTPGSTLTAIGEGGAKVKDLFSNNEDRTVVKAAYTYDGIHFTSLADPTGLNDPASTSGPGLRWAGSRGSIIANEHGSYTMFNSGGTCTDGDSDAFSRIFQSTSSDHGATWSTPTTFISTDYTFSDAAAFESAAAGSLLPISAYFGGRVYVPSVVKGPHGHLTMVFSGYRTPKPTPKVGTKVGRDPSTGVLESAPYTVGPTDPALYRSIITVPIKAARGN